MDTETSQVGLYNLFRSTSNHSSDQLLGPHKLFLIMNHDSGS